MRTFIGNPVFSRKKGTGVPQYYWTPPHPLLNQKFAKKKSQGSTPKLFQMLIQNKWRSSRTFDSKGGGGEGKKSCIISGYTGSALAVKIQDSR